MMNKKISDFLESYQIRISLHDRQSWEKVLDSKTVNSNLYCVPKKKSNKLDDLIDIDLVKGSTFPKTKYKLNLINLIINGLLRAAFMPLYMSWWKHQTSQKFTAILLIVYIFQLSNFYNIKYILLNQKDKQLTTLSEIFTPSILFLILSIVYSYITSSQTSTSDLEYLKSKKNYKNLSKENPRSTFPLKKRLKKQCETEDTELKSDEQSSFLGNRKLNSSSSPNLSNQQQQQQKLEKTKRASKYEYEFDDNDDLVEYDDDDDDEETMVDDVEEEVLEDEGDSELSLESQSQPEDSCHYSHHRSNLIIAGRANQRHDQNNNSSDFKMMKDENSYESDQNKTMNPIERMTKECEEANSVSVSPAPILNLGYSKSSSKSPKSKDSSLAEQLVDNKLLKFKEVGVKDKISCLIWQSNEWKGADLSMFEISHFIIKNVEKTSLSLYYFYIGVLFSFIIAFFPIYYHNSEKLTKYINDSLSSYESKLVGTVAITKQQQTAAGNVSSGFFENLFIDLVELNLRALLEKNLTFSNSIQLESLMILNTFFSTLFLSIMFFTLLSIAERTLVQRFLHAKYFCYLTSYRRARKNNLPHFRLGRVENIKTWLSVRSYMKRRGPQRSIDAIVSSTFLIGVVFCSIVCIRFLQDSEFLSDNLLNWKLVVWCLCIWTFLLRFMTIGFKINKKYRNCMSTVITEQINLYLQIEKKPEKKDELAVVNNVLKLAADLLKEIENPFKISGLGINPWVYNVTKVVILSASSAVLSELFGFKLKLYKIKIS